MISLDFEWQTNEFMLYCRTTQPTGISVFVLPVCLAYRFSILFDGMDLFTLSKILGHSSVEVTEQAYLDLTDDDICRQYHKASPLSNF